jgi:hypothetical protein
MPDKNEGKMSARDIQDAEEWEARRLARGLARAFGYALQLTIMSAVMPAGHSAEEDAIEAAAAAWEGLADKIVDFAKEN